jgi:hypothetical protein
VAVAIVNKKQTGSAAAASLAITKAASGNVLVAFISQSASTAEPTLAGWTFNATKAIFNTSASSLWLATKMANGTETEIAVTPAAGGTIQGITYWELSGCSETVDVIAHADNTANGKASTSPGVTTTDAGDVVLAAVGTTAGIGTISAWTGTGPMTNVETVSTRCMGGSYLPGSTLAAVTFTANWEISKVSGMLVVAFKPASAGVTVPLSAASSESSASLAVTAATRVPLAAASSVSAASAAVTAPTGVPLVPAASVSVAQLAVTAPTRVPLQPAASVSAAVLTVETPSAGVQVPLNAAVSASSATLALTAPTRVPLSPASSTSGASLTVSVPKLPEPSVAFGGALGGHSAGGARGLLGGTGEAAPILHGMGGAR